MVVSFSTLSNTSLKIALPNCLFKISLGTLPGLKPFKLTVPFISSYFSSIYEFIVSLSMKTLRSLYKPFLFSIVTFINFISRLKNY